MNDYVELRSVFATLFRNWWLLVLGAIVFGVAGYAYSTSQTPVYRATTSLFVGRPIGSAQLDRFDIQNSLQLARIYADIAGRQPVLERTVESLDLPIRWTDLRSRVRTNVSDQTQLLDISVDASSAEEARRAADEIARQLILVAPNGMRESGREQALQFTRDQLARLQEKITAGQTQLETLEGPLLNLATPQDVETLQENISALENMITRWESNYAQLSTLIDDEQTANNLAVLEPAQGSTSPIRPRVRLNTLIASFLGLALAVGFVFVRQFLDNSIETPEQVGRLFGLRTLGAISSIKSKNPQDALVIHHDPFSPLLEDYRLLRAKVQFLSQDTPRRAVMVTSPARGEGKSVTTANLGIVMAQAGLRTVLVDANLRQPILRELFQLTTQEGLTHLLRSEDPEIARYLSPTIVPNLRVLVSGALPPNPSELLGSPRMRQLLQQLAQMADIVICDAPEAVSVADASVLSSHMGGVLLVLEAGVSDRTITAQAVANLLDARANISGVVLNRISAKSRLVIFPKSSALPSQTGQRPDQPAYAGSARE